MHKTGAVTRAGRDWTHEMNVLMVIVQYIERREMNKIRNKVRIKKSHSQKKQIVEC